MLSETFIAAASAPPQLTIANTALLRDAGIFVHSFQPQPALRSTFKKSVAAPNCIAVSANHVFAAQSEKAVIHVYNRGKGNHEATVPFPERIHSLLLTCDDTILALGTASGSILLWELCTGRLLSTPQSHLQPITILAVDTRSNFLLSGSRDSNVNVWSLMDLLSFSTATELPTDEAMQPRLTLQDHRSAITALVVGHSASPANIAVSASEDATAIIWNYHSGERLRTFLLPATPLCLALDPADRAVYAGYKDGSVQLVSFYSAKSSATSVHETTHASTPIQPPSATRHFPQPSDADDGAAEAGSDAALSMSLSYDGTALVSGHASGKLNLWSITSTGSATTKLLAHYAGAPITSVHFLPPQGWPRAAPPRLNATTIVKPKPHEGFSGVRATLSSSYTFTAHLPSNLAATRDAEPSRRKRLKRSDDSGAAAFEAALASPLFPDDMLATVAAELAAWNSAPASNGTEALDGSQDFVSLDAGADDDGIMTAAAQRAENDERIAHLEKQVAHLRRLQEISVKHVDELMRENEGLRDDARARRQRDMASEGGVNGDGEIGDTAAMGVDEG